METDDRQNGEGKIIHAEQTKEMMTQNSVSQTADKIPYSAIKVFLLSIAVGFFLFALIFVFWNFYQLLTFTKTEGVVASVDTEQVNGKTPATFYELWVGFQVSKYQIYARAGTSVFYSPYNKGEKITVYYDPQNPNNVFINTFGTIWFVPTILFLLGFVPLIIFAPNKKNLKIIYKVWRNQK